MEIKKLGKYTFSQHYIYAQHNHADYEINYVHAGQCIMVVDGKNLPLRSGDCVVIEPGFQHNFIVSGTQPCQIMQFEFRLPDGARPVQNPQRLKLSHCADVLDSLRHLYTYHKQGGSSYCQKLFALEAEKLFVLLSMHLETAQTAQQPCGAPQLKEIMAYLDAHYDEPFNLESLAARHHITSRYMRKLFIQQMGFSATEYITTLRMEKAKDLLKNTTATISDIALQVGYSSLPYFSSMFKKRIQLTPKQFRMQYTI